MARTNLPLALMLAAALPALSVVPALPASAQPTPAEQGSGPYPALFEERPALPAHVVYRPRDLAAVPACGLGIYVFGNGACSTDGTMARNHLLEIASRGYIVIAPGTIPPPKPAMAAPPPPAQPAGAGAAPANQGMPRGRLSAPTPASSLTEAIDWAIAENARKDSPFHGKIATDQVAVSGWSCGGIQALDVASDPRVKTVVVMNSGYFPDGTSPIDNLVSDKSLLARLHGSVLYVLGGKEDIAYGNGTDDFARINHLPAAMINIPVGHGGTYGQPHGGLAAELVTAWLDWRLKGRADAGAKFTGPDCAYCKDSRFTLERKHFD